jgi:hypothetical protein
VAHPPTRDSATSEAAGRTIAELVAKQAIDADLAALLWVMAEAGVPLVVAADRVEDADELRRAIAELALLRGGLADGALPGRALGAARSLEDVIHLTGGQRPRGEPRDAGGELRDDVLELPDSARELGVVVVLRRPDGERDARVTAAHYVRPIERDGAGHIQRRPPALLAAWNDESGRLDHFDWGVADELAMRAGLDTRDFERLERRRRQLLDELAAARVFDRQQLRSHIERAALADVAADSPSHTDAPN